MARVIITVYDTDAGTRLRVELDPPLKTGEPETDAHAIALAMLAVVAPAMEEPDQLEVEDGDGLVGMKN